MQDSDLQKSFISSMRRVTSTVSVISSITGQGRCAMTATSVTSLSLNPPSMLVCVNKDASLHKILKKGSHFCINILANNQKKLAEVCSNTDEEESRFSLDCWIEKDNFIYSKDSLSNIFCECIDAVDHTTHTIFIGTVLEVLNSETAKPLLYGLGNYIE